MARPPVREAEVNPTIDDIADDHCPCCGCVHWVDSVRMPAEDADGAFTRCMICHSRNAPRVPGVKPWMDRMQEEILKQQQPKLL